MKKLIMFAACAVFACAANAAAMAWGGDTLNSANTDDGDWTGYARAGAIYTLVWLGSDYAGSTTATTYNKSTGLTDLGGEIKGTYTLTAEDADNGSWAGTPIEADADSLNGYWQIIAWDPNTPNVFDSQVGEMSGVTETQAGDLTTVIGSGLGSNMGGTVTGGGAVPEPTSGLLMLVGLGALALRRRR